MVPSGDKIYQYESIFDMAKRIDLRAANKKTFENLALAGGFDSFSPHRAQYFNPDGDGVMFFEKAMRFGSKYQENLNSLQSKIINVDKGNNTNETSNDKSTSTENGNSKDSDEKNTLINTLSYMDTIFKDNFSISNSCTSAFPAATTILPQLGSSPKAAVFTKGEFAIFIAIFLQLSSDDNPFTVIFKSLVDPSPSKTNFSDNF